MSLRSKARDALLIYKLTLGFVVLCCVAAVFVVAFRVFQVLLVLGTVGILGWVVFQMVRGGVRAYDRRKAWRDYRKEYAAWEAATSASVVAEVADPAEAVVARGKEPQLSNEGADVTKAGPDVLVLDEPSDSVARATSVSQSTGADSSHVARSMAIAEPPSTPSEREVLLEPSAFARPPVEHLAEPVAPPADEPKKPRNGMATTGFVLGILTAVCTVLWVPVALDPVVAIPAIVFASIGLHRASRLSTGQSKAWIGLGLGILGVLVWVLQAFLYLK
ncbi:hypothetical protein [Leifsonia sp. P73]|uniref:hypothetical protein n=1 Tax=Leifsonia sp. P73 TaxID=3423959 RepID=UPI003DA58FF6